jgi:DNA-binding MarR family transcriptional regulator
VPGDGAGRTDPLDPGEAAWGALWSACLGMRRALGRDLSRAGGELSLPELQVLRQLELAGDGLSMSDLGRCAGLTAAGTSRIVGHLVDAGLVELGRPTPDRRVQHVNLLPSARPQLVWAHNAVSGRLHSIPERTTLAVAAAISELSRRRVP